MSYKSWREAQAGDWGLTDDGYLTECLYVKEYGKDVMKRFSIGRVWARSKTFEYIPRLRNGQFHATTPDHWERIEARKARMKRLVQVMALQTLQGKVDYNKLGQVYRQDQKSPDLTVRMLMKRETFKSMLQEELEKLLADKGVTPSQAIDILKRAAELAETDGDAKAMVAVWKEMKDLLNLAPKQKVVEEFDASEQIRQIASGVVEEKRRISATRTTELPLGAEGLPGERLQDRVGDGGGYQPERQEVLRGDTSDDQREMGSDSPHEDVR